MNEQASPTSPRSPQNFLTHRPWNSARAARGCIRRFFSFLPSASRDPLLLLLTAGDLACPLRVIGS